MSNSRLLTISLEFLVLRDRNKQVTGLFLSPDAGAVVDFVYIFKYIGSIRWKTQQKSG